MRQRDFEQGLYSDISALDVIDCHEHLPPESWRLRETVDVFTLFACYTRGDLIGAGMTAKEAERLHDSRVSLDERWKLFSPFLERIRDTSFTRSALLSAKIFYGFDDINNKTYRGLSGAVGKENRPGIYRRVLRDACRIRTALSQWGEDGLPGFRGITDFGTDLLTPVMRAPLLWETTTWETLAHPAFAPDAGIRTLDDFLHTADGYIRKAKKKGAVGFKMISQPYGVPDRGRALRLFRRLRENRPLKLPVPNPLLDYLLDEEIRMVGAQDRVVAVHTGYWGDFRQLDPLHMIPAIVRHRNVRFDIYHVGYPWIRETLMLAKEHPNVWLNFCWLHIISDLAARKALDEAIDLLPCNKILGFGGDYGVSVEKICGHIELARRNMAAVLAGRVRRGTFGPARALDLARRWLFSNPVELYALGLRP